MKTWPLHSAGPLRSRRARTSGQFATGCGALFTEEFTSHSGQYGGGNDSAQDWKAVRVARIEQHGNPGRKLGEQIRSEGREEGGIADVAGQAVRGGEHDGPRPRPGRSATRTPGRDGRGAYTVASSNATSKSSGCRRPARISWAAITTAGSCWWLRTDATVGE